MSDVTHALPPHLLDAYRVTCYRVWSPSLELHLHVDRHDADLARLLLEAKVDSAALLTAWNPGSRMQSLETNQARQAALERDLHDAAFVYLPARNGAPVDYATTAQWNEDSVLVPGMDIDTARALAIRYGQLAFLWIDGKATPRLIVTAPAAQP